MNFTDVYRKHYAFVLGKFLRHYSKDEAEDRTQEVFIYLFKNIHKYDSKYAMTTFLTLFVNNVYSDESEYRSRCGRSDAVLTPLEVVLEDEALDRYLEDPSALQAFTATEQALDVQRRIEALNVNQTQRALLRMVLIEGRSALEMQAATGKDWNYVRRAKVRAMKALAEQELAV